MNTKKPNTHKSFLPYLLARFKNLIRIPTLLSGISNHVPDQNKHELTKAKGTKLYLEYSDIVTLVKGKVVGSVPRVRMHHTVNNAHEVGAFARCVDLQLAVTGRVWCWGTGGQLWAGFKCQDVTDRHFVDKNHIINVTKLFVIVTRML